MKTSDAIISFIMVLVMALVFVGMIAFIGYDIAESRWQKSAIRHGAAHWEVLDSERGGTTFVWNTPEQPESK